MSTPLLTLVTNRAKARLPLTALAQEAVDGGVDIVHIRERELDATSLQLVVSDVIDAVGPDRVAVNDAPKLAARLGVHLHLPERSLSGFEAPTDLRSVSCSIHSTDSLRIAPAAASYVIAGHVFSTTSHPGAPPLGIGGLRAIAATSARPVIAIGGITPDTAAEVVNAGAAGIAVMSYVNSSPEPRLAARELRDTLERSMNQRATAVEIRVNGKLMSLDGETTLTSFLVQRNLHPRLVVVERNREIVAKACYDSTLLEEGDLLEIAHFVGGG